MKHKELIIILVLIIILIGLLTIYVITNSSSNSDENMYNNIKENQQRTETTTTLKNNCEIKSASIEKIEPHAGYYLEEVYVEEKQYVTEGTNILKYTNGNYLVAPYDCCITELELPNIDDKCLNSHYIQIESSNVLATSMKVEEENIDKITIGTEVKVKVSAIDKSYTGYVTHIASTASNGKFEVDIELENDGNIKLGMTANLEISI